jgi:hypothetical protein
MRFPSLPSQGWLAAAALASGCATPPTPPNAPAALQPPANLVLSLEALADGVQIYECRFAPESPGHYVWVLKGPETDLRSRSGSVIGKHYAGPTWQWKDGSKVVGVSTAHVDSPDGKAIPWLLLGAKSHEGEGKLSQVESIQRLDTTGGVAPTEPCTGARTNEAVRVPYTATYYFYTVPR